MWLVTSSRGLRMNFILENQALAHDESWVDVTFRQALRYLKMKPPYFSNENYTLYSSLQPSHTRSSPSLYHFS